MFLSDWYTGNPATIFLMIVSLSINAIFYIFFGILNTIFLQGL